MTKMKGWWSGLSRRTLMIGGAVMALLLISVIVVVAMGYDFTPANAGEVINGAVIRVFNPTDPSGSGTFDAFVRISSNQGVIRGYNTSYRPLQFEENSSPTFTKDFLLSEVPVTTDPGGEPGIFREFQLDINQNTSGDNRYLTLDNVEVFEAGFAGICGYPFDGSGGGHSGCTSDNTATLIWGMDELEDNWIVLDYTNNEGSGKRDLRLLIPNEYFDQSPACQYLGTGCTTYVVLYSKFGGDSGAGDPPIVNTPHPNNDGFEEWGVAIYELATKSGYKWNDLNADGIWQQGDEPGLPGWTIYVDLNDDGVHDMGEPYGVTDGTGYYEITNIVAGGPYKVREVDQADWYCSFPANCYYEETFEQGGSYPDNNFGNYQYTPDIDIDKTGDTLSKVGDDVNYTITVDNTSGPGTPDLYCHITDAMLGIDEYVTLARDDPDYVINKSYTVPAGAPDPLVNTASVSCTYVGDTTEQASDSDDHSVNLFQPAIELTKSGDDLSKIGDTVDYVITLYNNSSDDTPDLECRVTDAMLGVDETFMIGSGDAPHVINVNGFVIPEDADDPFVNVAEVVCSPDGFPNEYPDSARWEVNLFQPAIELTKSGDDLSKIGDTVDYVITLYNNSSADTPDLTCTVTDAMLGVDETFTVASGGNHPINVNGFVIPDDADDPFVNVAEVVCSPDGFPNEYPDSARWETNLFQPAIELTKSGDDLSKIGDTVDYVITLYNNSSADTPDLECRVTDAMLGVDETFTVASGGNHPINVNGFVIPDDADDPFVNVAEVVCSPEGFPNEYPDSARWEVNLFQPCVTIDKEAAEEYSKAGDDVHYTITVDNCSSDDTPDLECNVTDGMLGIDEDVTLAWDAADHVINATYTVQPGDPDPLENTAYLTCSPQGFPNVYDDEASASVDLVHPSFTLDKTCMDEPVVAGEDATFEVVFDNTGDVDLVVEFDEDLSGTGCPAAGVPVTVADGESLVCTVAVPADTDPSASTVDNEVNAHVTLPAWTGLDNYWDPTASDSCDIYGVKSGYKWWDMNANGEWDGGELGLSGWTIDLLLADGTAVGSTTTGSGGYYEFNMVVPGEDYVVCEVLEPGWHQSYPMGTADCTAFGAQYGAWGYAINLMSGEIEDENNFGNYEDIGCTLTQGYWKTHSEYGPAPYDATWAKLPGGADTPFFDTGMSWYEVFHTPPAGGNAYYILAHQYMAAILNSLKDEDPAATSMIAAELAQAEALLDFYDGDKWIPADGTQFSDNDRALAISIAETLDWFNNGELPGGPPHCE